jgi:hypothetical protein
MSYDSTIEDLVDTVHTFLQTNVPAYVTAINTAKDDGLTLAAIREFVVSDQDPYSGSMRPRMQLYVEGMETEHIASGWSRAVMTFTALISIDDSSDQRKRLVRYTEAVRQALRDYYDIGTEDFDIDPRGMSIAYFPTDPETAVGIATIRFRAIKEIPA